jgi:hypothetical protein
VIKFVHLAMSNAQSAVVGAHCVFALSPSWWIYAVSGVQLVTSTYSRRSNFRLCTSSGRSMYDMTTPSSCPPLSAIASTRSAYTRHFQDFMIPVLFTFKSPVMVLLVLLTSDCRSWMPRPCEPPAGLKIQVCWPMPRFMHRLLVESERDWMLHLGRC